VTEVSKVAPQPSQSTVTILDFWADWCGPCRLIDPVVNRVAKGRAGVMLKKVDAAQATDLVAKHHVLALPTLIFLAPDGRELSRLSGPIIGRQIEASLDQAVAEAG
jgi:thioredoxin-like negative regulator of GroEL